MSRYPQLKTRQLLLLLFMVIFLVGSGIRLFSLGTSVPILNRDEAALAYNAYLLVTTGRDEWGVRWPVTLQSFGDYKLIGYPTLLTLLYRVLPLSDTVVRLPAALAGIGLLVVSYFFGRQFGLRKFYAVLFVGVIALSPVFIFFSRFAYEANVALLYVAISLLIWFRPTHKLWHRFLLDLLGVSLFALACLTYNSPFILFPFCVVIVILSRVSKGWKTWLPLLFLFTLAFSVICWQLLPVLQQKSGISIFTDATVSHTFVQYRSSIPDVLQTLVGNQYLFWAGLMAQAYLKSFSPLFLIDRPLHPWHGVLAWGQLLLPVMVLGWLGVGWLVISLAKQLKKIIFRSSPFSQLAESSKFRLVCLLFVSLLPASITVDAPHATRSLLFLYLLSLIALLFLQAVLRRWHLRHTNHTLIATAPLIFFVLLMVSTASFYVYDLFIRYPVDARSLYQFGFREALTDVSDADSVAIVDPGGYQYVLLAWYLRTNPQEYFQTNVRQLPDKIGFRYGEQVGKYHFIAQTADRSASESALVQWDEDSATWQVTP